MVNKVGRVVRCLEIPLLRCCYLEGSRSSQRQGPDQGNVFLPLACRDMATNDNHDESMQTTTAGIALNDHGPSVAFFHCRVLAFSPNRGPPQNMLKSFPVAKMVTVNQCRVRADGQCRHLRIRNDLGRGEMNTRPENFFFLFF
jgi:hypothetical protein